MDTGAAGTSLAPTSPATAATAAAKAQEFAHRIVEFADFDACCKFFREKAVDFNVPTDTGWSLLMRICACGRADLVGYAADATSIVSCATVPNRTNVLHLAAMSTNPQVMRELVATPERRAKLLAIADSPNVNGDTPLMMASVAKNADAARLLLAELSANASYGNANGMTALMCAARLGDSSVEQLATAGEEIVRLLLATGVQVNATEVAAGNSALHFAVLSHNVRGVRAFTARQVDADVSLRNAAGLTPIDLAKRTGASAEIVECLERRLADMEELAAERRVALANELLDGMKTTRRANTSRKSKKSKAKKPTAAAPSDRPAGPLESADDEREGAEADSDLVRGSEGDGARDASPPIAAVTTPAAADPVGSVKAASPAQRDDGGDWQQVAAKKTRRKPSIEEEKTRATAAAPHKQQQQRAKARAPKTRAKAAEATSSPPVAVKTVAQASDSAIAPVPQARTPVPSSAAAAERSLDGDSGAGSAESSPRHSSASYHTLNAIFHRTFPMADELDIPVEAFVIASSSTDIELQPSDGGLSISQLETLQEAHLQAYHYLTEKKLELTRVLEAQRLEAQFALQHELLHLDA